MKWPKMPKNGSHPNGDGHTVLISTHFVVDGWYRVVQSPKAKKVQAVKLPLTVSSYLTELFPSLVYIYSF